MAPKTFGRFEIQSLLGKGAMGVVYKAHDPTLNRDVAIKVVRFPKELEPWQLKEMKKGLLKDAQMAAGLTPKKEEKKAVSDTAGGPPSSDETVLMSSGDKTVFQAPGEGAADE